MVSRLLCTDVLVIRCTDNLIFAGIGYILHVFNAATYQLESKINCLHPYNIHGIVEGPNNKIAVFGANSFNTCTVYRKQGTLVVEKDSKKCLNDWIIAVQWLTLEGHNHLSILLAHNNVYIYNLSNEHYENVYCNEKCILYSGSIFVKGDKNLIIFSGTVFQDILIWEVQHGSPCVKPASILHRLQGHNGVIFSVTYYPLIQLICSTSDDRTVRLWKVDSNEIGDKAVMDWKRVEVKLIRTMFGHAARVWKSVIRNEMLITIGEDSLMCTWSLDGTLVNKICAHHGAAVWSIDISNDNKTVFTGGADGAINAWSVGNDYSQTIISLPKTDTCNFPKYVCFLNNGSYVVFNEGGTLFVFDRSQNHPRESLYLERYSAYCVMEVSLCHSYVCFASKDGYVTIYKEIDTTSNRKLQQIVEANIMESQIFSVQWLESNKLIASGSNGILKIFSFNTKGSVTVESVCLLPPSRERWLTAAIFYEGLLVCGDRAGNMHVFAWQESIARNGRNLTETSNKPKQTFFKVHGKIGVQSLIIFRSRLMSTGRDGTLRFYELHKEEKEDTKTLIALHKEKMPMDWISSSLSISNDILVLGFKEVEFVVYSMLHRRIIRRILCGGGHRSWDCTLTDELITFLYIRNKQVCVFDFSLSSLKSPVLLNGFHTKEVYCVRPISTLSEENICISGGEDGTIRIISISNASLKDHFRFQTLGVFDGHICGVKFVDYMNVRSDKSQEKNLVFSGGGRAQLKVWEVTIKYGNNLLESTNVSCRDIVSHMLYGFDRYRKKQWQENNHQSYVLQPETRYMDMATYRNPLDDRYAYLFVACGDGFVRMFLYDIEARHISLRMHAKCANRCITKICILREKKVIALIMSTDGIGRLVDFTDIVTRIRSTMESEDQEFHDCTDASFAKFHLHQSGITSYDLRMFHGDEYLLATGGDDNLLSLVRFKISSSDEKELNVSVLSEWNTSNAHFAQITGIQFYGDSNICSVGLDQQFITHEYKYKDSNLSARVLKRTFTCVTDAKGFACWNIIRRNILSESVVCVYGKGFEIFSR